MSYPDAFVLGLVIGVGVQLGANIVKAVWRWWNA